jgi:hypothetical protein
VDFDRIGLPAGQSYQAKELWSGETINVSNAFTISLKPADAALYKLSRDVQKRN